MKRISSLMLSVLFLASCTAQKPPTIAPESEKRVSFVAVGDNIIYKGTVLDAKVNAKDGREYDFRPIYSEVQSIIEDADIAFINQETVMTGGEPSYYPMFNSPRQVGLDIIDVGFDVVNISNNHMLDKGAGGLTKTIEFWKGQPVLMIGGYENEQDYKTPRVLEKNGIKIAFLSYTYGTNGMKVPSGSELKIPYIDDAKIEDEVKKAKENADFIVCSVHWGEEGHLKPSTAQKDFAKSLADNGVDVILGHHPHVIQPTEWIEGTDGNKTLCVYSLGNFAAEQAYDYNMVGGMISFDLVKKGEEQKVENPEFSPTVYHYDARFKNNKVYLMKNYTPDLAEKHGVKGYYKNTLTYDRLLTYAKDTISEEFLRN